MSELKRINLSVQRERAVLVKVIIGRSRTRAPHPLSELSDLAKAAGAIVVDELIQKLNRVATRTYLGKGKLAQLTDCVQTANADLVIFDNELSPGQIREIERAVNRKVLDRSELILDIFAARARTHEAKLQVELAQLEYTAPRLRGMWTHLERIAGAGGATAAGKVGGIGTRGPGERQIEIDRRIVRDRVAALQRELDVIDQRKVRQVQSRVDCFKVSLVGYTNSGKSTLLNALTDAGQYTADKLFATLDSKTVRWRLDDSKTVLLNDTVGFVRELPHRLVASFRATLEETLHADLILHVIDASNPEALMQVQAVDAVLDELDCPETPRLSLLNKIDIMTDEADVQILERRVPNPYRVSARTGAGLDRVVEAVRQVIRADTTHATIRFPSADGRLAAAIDQHAQVLARRYAEDHVELDVVIDRAHLDQLASRYAGLNVVSTDAREQSE